MRYYVLAIQHNAEKDAENRTAPKAFDTIFDAKTEYHKQLANDMANATLDWGVVYILDNNGNIIISERFDKVVVVAKEE